MTWTTCLHLVPLFDIYKLIKLPRLYSIGDKLINGYGILVE